MKLHRVHSLDSSQIRQIQTMVNKCTDSDGARLSFMGLPCPNLCAGGHNFHGRYEYVPVQSMEKITEMLLRIVEQFVAAK